MLYGTRKELNKKLKRMFGNEERYALLVWTKEDVMAQAWPLLWSLPEDRLTRERGRQAWQRVSARWPEWPRRNVDPAGFWWPAAAVAAHCSGDGRAAAEWVARARTAWLRPDTPFAWPFQVSDLLWLLWLAEPGPPQAPLPEPLDVAAPASGRKP